MFIRFMTTGSRRDDYLDAESFDDLIQRELYIKKEYITGVIQTRVANRNGEEFDIVKLMTKDENYFINLNINDFFQKYGNDILHDDPPRNFRTGGNV